MSTRRSLRPRAVAAAATAAGLSLVAATLAPGAAPGAVAAPAAERAGAARVIELPDGFQPEGIAIGQGGVGYVGSLADGSIYSFDLGTGARVGRIPGPGTPAVGLDREVGQNRLYVSGGDAGTARLIDLDTERTVADYTLTTGPAFINDVIVTQRAAWFTNSSAPELYRVPITKDGAVPPAERVRTIELRGDYVQPDGLGANGITETPDGTALLVVDTTDGTLFRVATKGPRAGVARTVDLGGQSLVNGDGMLLQGRTLYVVRNQDNVIIELKLNARGTAGRTVGTRTARSFDVPTTIAARRGRLYLPNARFTTPPTPRTPYTVSVLKKR